MGHHFRIVAGLGLLLLLSAASVRGQWSIVAPNLLEPEQQYTGAIQFHNGFAWAGTRSLYYSNDSGITWKRCLSFPSIQPASGISDISIYDSLHVLVGVINEGLFLTTDAGETWKNILPSTLTQHTIIQVAFNRSSSTIYMLDQGVDNSFFMSLDGGSTWTGVRTTVSSSALPLCFAIGADQRLYVFVISVPYNVPNAGWINMSTDAGKTWSGNSSHTDGDCNTISVDSCDGRRLYLINENAVARAGNEVRIDLTTNAGASWEARNSHTVDFTKPRWPGYYNGSLANTGRVLYAGTVPDGGDGIIRSTDKGLSWQNIGGPTEYFDTRAIAAINDNIVLVLDKDGSIWRSTNSGGDTVISESRFKVLTSNVKADTLGGLVEVPFTIDGLIRPEDVELVLHYDGSVDYLGSFSPSGVKLDIPGEQWAGRSKLLIDNVTPNVIAGYATFRVFNDLNSDAHATFDSVRMLSSPTFCEQSGSADAGTSTISSPSSCGASLLSRWVHLDQQPQLVVQPNPTTGNVWISSSHDLGDVRIEVYDMLGKMRNAIESRIKQGNRFEVTLPAEKGIYQVLLRASDEVFSLRVVRRE